MTDSDRCCWGRARRPSTPYFALVVSLVLLGLAAGAALLASGAQRERIDTEAQNRLAVEVTVAAEAVRLSSDSLQRQLQTLARYHQSACAATGTQEGVEVPLGSLSSFATMAGQALADHDDIDVLAFAVHSRTDLERHTVERLASQEAGLASTKQAFAWAAGTHTPVPVAYSNQSLLITAVAATSHLTQQDLAASELLTTVQQPGFEQVLQAMTSAAQSGTPASTALLPMLAPVVLLYPVYRCGSTAANVASTSSNTAITSPHLAGWLISGYNPATLLPAKLAPLISVQERLSIEVHELSQHGAASEPTLMYSGGVQASGTSKATVVDLLGRQLRVTVTDASNESDSQLEVLVAVLPLALGCVAALAVLAVSVIVTRLKASSSKMTMEAMDAAHEYIVAYICHEMRNPLHACLALLDLARQGTSRAEQLPAEVESDLSGAMKAGREMKRVLDDVMSMRHSEAEYDEAAPAQPVAVGNVSDVLRDVSNQQRYLLDPAVHMQMDLTTCPGFVDRGRLRQVLDRGLHKATNSTKAGVIALVTQACTTPCEPAGCSVCGAPPPEGVSEERDDGTCCRRRWVLCQIISTPARPLPSAVQQWNAGLQASHPPPKAITSLLETPFPARTLTGRCMSSPHSSSMESELGMSTTVSVSDSELTPHHHRVGTMTSPRRRNSRQLERTRAIVEQLRSRTQSKRGLAHSAALVRGMGGYMGLHASGVDRHVRYWVAVPVGVKCYHGVAEVEPVVTLDAGSLDRHLGTGQGMAVPRQRAAPEKSMSGSSVQLEAVAEVQEGKATDPDEVAVLMTPYVDTRSQRDVNAEANAKASAEANAKANAEGSAAGGQVVVAVVDDEPLIVKTTSRFVKRLGHTAVGYSDGLPLVDDLTEAGNPAGVTVVLLDIIMRNSNGVEVCRSLRAAGCTLPIIAMTSNVDPASLKVYNSTGFSGVLAKPFTRKELKTVLTFK